MTIYFILELKLTKVYAYTTLIFIKNYRNPAYKKQEAGIYYTILGITTKIKGM